MSVFEFGGTRYIDPGISGIALVSTVVFLAVCDFSTHCLEKFLGHSTIYMSMLRKIYKELMIMGIVSFCLVMYQAAHPNTSNEVHLWISTFDYVGFVLFFNAIYTVVHALSIIVWSLRTSEEYNRFHSISITDVSLKIEKLKQNWFLRKLYELNYYPFLSTRQIAEFKVIHVLFRNTFGVPIDFNFGEYLGKCFERYSLNILNLSVASWIVMFVLYGINMIRIYTPYPNNSFKCGEKLEQEDQGHEDQGGGGHRMLSSTTSIIESMVNMMWNMFLFNVINVDDNVNDNDINGDENDNGDNDNIDINGDDNGNDHDDHDDHDMKSEDSSESINNCDLSYVRLFVLCSSILEFYVLLVFMMGRVYTLRLLRKAGVDSITKVTDDLVYFLDEEAAREHIYHNKIVASEKSSHGRRMSIKTFSKFIEKAKDVKSKKNTPEGNNQTTVAAARHLRGNRPSKFHLVSNYEPTQTSSILSQKENLFTITRKIEAQRKKSVELRHRGRHNELKLAEDFSDIYAFQSPTLYFRAVELGIVLNCIYLSLWVGDFIFIANQLGESSSFYQLLMAIPCVFLIPLLTQTVKTASLLAAIAALDVDVIAEVLEESEERTYLIEELRSKIIQRTASRGLQKRELLESVFKEIDTDGSGEINRSELRSVLVKLDMGYSGKKFNRLYTAIDRNGDGSLSITELNHLLFPEDAQQKEVEELGAKVQSRIDRRITALETEQRSESSNVPLRAHQKRSEQINSLKTLSISGRKLSGNIPEETSPEVLPINSSDIINCPKLVESPSAIIARSISKLKERNLISLRKDKKNIKNDDSDSNSSSNSVSNSSSNKEESIIDKDKIPNSSNNLQDNISVTSPKPVAVIESKLDNFQNEIDHVHTSMSMTDPISTLLPSSLSISEKEPMVDQPIPNEQNEINEQYSNMNLIKLPPVISHKQDAIQNHKKKIKPEYQIQTNYPPNFIVDNQQPSPQHSNYQNFKSFSTDGYNPQFHPQKHPLISPMNQNIPDQSHLLMERVRRHLRETQGHSQRRIEPINIDTNDNNENNDWEYSKVNNNENQNKRNNDKSKVKSKTNTKNFQKQGSGSFSFPHFPSDQFDGKYIDNKTSDIGYGRNDTLNDTRVDVDQEIAEDKHSSISHNHSKDVLRNSSDGYLKSSTSTSAFTSSSIHRNSRKYKHEEQDKNRNGDNEDQFQHLNRNFNPNHQNNNNNHSNNNHSNNSNNQHHNQQRNNQQQYQYHHHHHQYHDHDSNYQHRINDMYVDEESGNLYYDNHHHHHHRNNENYHNRNYHNNNNNNNFNYHHNSHNSHNSHNNSNIYMSSNTNIDDRRDNDRIGSWEIGYERVEYDMNDNENYNDNDNRDEMLQRHNEDSYVNMERYNTSGDYGYDGYENNFDYRHHAESSYAHHPRFQQPH